MLAVELRNQFDRSIMGQSVVLQCAGGNFERFPMARAYSDVTDLLGIVLDCLDSCGLRQFKHKAQVGHAPRDIEEKHYLDPHLVDPAESSQAVYDILIGKRELRGKRKDADKLTRCWG